MFYDGELRFLENILRKCHLQTARLDPEKPLAEEFPYVVRYAEQGKTFYDLFPDIRPHTIYHITDASLCRYIVLHLTGDKCVLGNEIGIIKNDMPDCINSFVGVILPDNIEEELLEVIADNFRYLIVYSHERDVRAKAAEHIMKYNSTAVITADKLYSLYDAKVIISVNTGTSRPPEGYPGKFIYAYPSFSGHDDRVCVNAYTENFTGIKLSAAYFEALRLND